MALQQIGSEIIIAGTQRFLADSAAVNAAIARTNAALETQARTAAKSSKQGLGFNEAVAGKVKEVEAAVQKIQKVVKVIQTAAKLISLAFGPLGKIIARSLSLALKTGLAGGVINGILATFQKAIVTSIRGIFGQAAGTAADAFLDKLRPKLAEGLVSVLKLLLQAYNQIGKQLDKQQGLKKLIDAIAISDQTLNPLIKLTTQLDIVAKALEKVGLEADTLGGKYNGLITKAGQLDTALKLAGKQGSAAAKVIDIITFPQRAIASAIASAIGLGFRLANSLVVQPALFIARTFGDFIKTFLLTSIRAFLLGSIITQLIKGRESQLLSLFRSIGQRIGGEAGAAITEELGKSLLKFAQNNLVSTLLSQAKGGNFAGTQGIRKGAEVGQQFATRLRERGRVGADTAVVKGKQAVAVANQKIAVAANQASESENRLVDALRKSVTAGRDKAVATIKSGKLPSFSDVFSAGKDRFTESLTSNKGVDFSSIAESASKAAQGINLKQKALSGLQSIMNTAKGGLNALAKGFQALPPQLQAVIVALGAVAVAVGAAIVAFKVASFAVKTFFSLANRAATIKGLAQGFDQAAERAGVFSDVLLNNLRVASGGTITDFNLMKSANLALAGSTGIAAKAIGENLPKILEIARVQARQTGQSVDFLFESLVTGIKKAEPELIDNTGLLVRIGDANKAYAESIGKTVEALTAQERSIALLNATIAAGEISLSQTDLSDQTASELQQRITTSIENIKNTLGTAIQPIFEGLLGIVAGIFSRIEEGVRTIAPLIYFVAQAIKIVLTGIQALLFGLYDFFVAPLVRELPYIIAILQVIHGVVSTVANAIFGFIGGLVSGVVGAVRGVLESLGIIQAGAAALEGGLLVSGARIMGAFAAGLADAANKYVFPVVTAIAKAIADFLIGESPPPEGPLSVIDKGGANTMLAWLGGFAGVSLDPVTKVAQEVSSRLGGVANYSLDQIKTRLGELDRELLPFQNRLDLVNARLEAMTEPLNKAKEIIERRLDDAVKVFTQSGGKNIEEVTRLDKQREILAEQLKLAQATSDEAELQLVLAQAKQAEERAALAVQQRILEATQGVSSASSGGGAGSEGSDAADRAAKAGGGGGGAGASTGSQETTAGGGGGNVLDSILGLDKVNEAKAKLQEAFLEGADGGKSFGELGVNAGALQTQIGRIQQGLSGDNITSRITETFSGLTDGITQPIQEAYDKVVEFFGADGKVAQLFTVGSPYGATGSIRTAITATFTGLTDVVTGSIDPVTAYLQQQFSTESSTALLFADGGIFGQTGLVKTAFNTTFGDLSVLLKNSIGTLPTYLEEQFGLESPLGLLFGEEGIFGPEGVIKSAFLSVFGGAETQGTILNLVSTFVSALGEQTALIPAAFSIFTDPNSAFKQLPNTVDGILKQVITFFQNFAGAGELSIGQALSSLPDTLATALKAPFVDAINGVITTVVSGINSVITAVNAAIDALNKAGIPGISIPDKLSTLDAGAYLLSYHSGGKIPGTPGRELPILAQRGEGVLSLPMMKVLYNLERKLSSVPSYLPPVLSRSGNTYDQSHRIHVENLSYHHQANAGRTISDLMMMSARGVF